MVRIAGIEAGSTADGIGIGTGEAAGAPRHRWTGADR